MLSRPLGSLGTSQAQMRLLLWNCNGSMVVMGDVEVLCDKKILNISAEKAVESTVASLMSSIMESFPFFDSEMFLNFLIVQIFLLIIPVLLLYIFSYWSACSY